MAFGEDDSNEDAENRNDGSTLKKWKLNVQPTVGRSVRGEDFWSRITHELKTLLGKHQKKEDGKVDASLVIQ